MQNKNKNTAKNNNESPLLQYTSLIMQADVLTKMSVQSALQENTELTCSTSTAETPTDSCIKLHTVTAEYSYLVKKKKKNRAFIWLTLLGNN